MKRIIGVVALMALVFAAVACAENWIGTSADNVWHGTSGADTADGQSGHDDLYAEGGADDVWGGAGSDLLRGGGGNDDLFAGCRPNSGCPGPGKDNIIVGDDGNDGIGADNGMHDTVSGGPGWDTCHIDLGDDVGIYGCEVLFIDGVRQSEPVQ